MKLIKNFKKFFDNRKIDSICREYGIEDYTINEDGSIDVDGNVYISYKRLTKLPLKFGRVTSDFYCHNNNLTSLEGCPKWVGRNFDCHNNNLTTLEGGPESVGDGFYCHNNNLTSLKGSPSSIDGDFFCNNNQLTTLEGGPRVVNYKFDCSGNQLTNLIGGPEWVKYDYVASNNQITSFEGFPDKHNDDCYFSGNPVNKILRKIPPKLWKRAIPLIIDYDAIWNGEIVPERLEMVKEKLPKFDMKRHKDWPYRPDYYDIDYDDYDIDYDD
jgi:hypothetical protein